MAKARKSPERGKPVDWRRSQGPTCIEQIHAEVIRQLAAGAACTPEMACVLLDTSAPGEARAQAFAAELIVQCVGARGRRW